MEKSKQVMTLLIIFMVAVVGYLIWLNIAVDNTQTACTQDVMLCPDGSYVAREGASCQFKLCPSPVSPQLSTTTSYCISNNCKAQTIILSTSSLPSGCFVNLTQCQAGITTDKSNLIKADSPTADQLVRSPLVVRGVARGNWYFEAVFPVVLYDGSGKEITRAQAEAQGDWMTTDFVPYEAVLTFQVPTTATGTLSLQKDNPSGLPQNDDKLTIPIRFK